jgi:RNA polymerase sigma factor (sigma-70 family)
LRHTLRVSEDQKAITVATAIRSSGQPKRSRPTRDEIDPIAVALLERHGAQLMATARRYAATAEDAEDAYQRGVEILLTKAPNTDPAELLPWLKTVVKHEAFAVRKQAERHGVPSEPWDIEPHAGRAPAPADLAEHRDRLRLGSEAMQQLKPQEMRALMLRAEGLSYEEICAATGWTYTKVNRCLSEGRKSFVERVARIETGAECELIAPVLSALADGEARTEDLTRVRQHLRHCLACRARLREYRSAPSRVAALAPLGLVGSLWAALRALVGSRWHGLGQLAAANKSAAVAVSTVALAGGGAATVATLPHAAPHPHRSRLERTSGTALQFRDASAARVRARPATGGAAHRSSRPQRNSQLVLTPAPAQAATSSATAPSTAPTASSSGAGGSGNPAAPGPSGPAASAPAPAASPAHAAPSGGGGGEFAP